MGFASITPLAETSAQPFSSEMIALNAVGFCVLVVWIVRRLINPRKFSLANSPGRANTVEPVHIFILLLIWISVQLLMVQVLKGVFGEKSDKLAILSAIVAQVVWLAGSIMVARWTFRYGLVRGLGLSVRHWIFDTARAVVAYLAVLPLATGALLIVLLLVPKSFVEEHEHEMLKAIVSVSVWWKVLVFVSTVVLAPLAEELFFRGLIQSMLRRYLGRPWAAILITSAFFALVHFGVPQTMPALFILAIVLGYNYERCGRLYPSILLHAIFNAVGLADTLWWN